jgi:hypothetical protein
MAIATGSQIRPELSAVDYTPFLQASGQAAQMQARGAENIAKGLEEMVNKVGKAVNERKAQNEGVALIKSLYPDIDDKTALYGLKSAGGATAFIKFKTDFDQYKKITADRSKSAEYGQKLLENKGAAPSGEYTNEQVIGGRNIYLDFLKSEGSVSKMGAETAATNELANARKAETAAKTKDETIISTLIKEFTADQGIPSGLRNPNRPKVDAQSLLINAAQRGLSTDGLGKVSQLAGALTRTREAGFDNPNDAVSSIPENTLPVGYVVLPEQDKKTGKWFANPTQGTALKSLSSDYTLIRDPQTGVPVAKAIPGSTADVKNVDKVKKEKESTETYNYHISADRDNVLSALWLLDHGARTGTLALTGMIGPLSGTQTQQYVRLVDSVRNAAGINSLMQLKRSSPTGGGPLGTASDKDLSAVISSVAPYYATDKEENVRSGLLKTLSLYNDFASREGSIGRLEYKDYEKQIMQSNLKKKQATGEIPTTRPSAVDYFKMNYIPRN